METMSVEAAMAKIKGDLQTSITTATEILKNIHPLAISTHIVCLPHNIGIAFDSRGKASSCGVLKATRMTETEAKSLAPTVSNGKGQPAIAILYSDALTIFIKETEEVLAESFYE